MDARVFCEWFLTGFHKGQCSELANMEKLKFFAIKTAVWAIYINQQKVNFFAEEEVEVKDFIYMIQKSVSKSYGTFPKSSLKHCKENSLRSLYGL